MLDPALVIKFSGPPGTGKSTTLLNALDEHLTQGTPPEDIIFTTFTKAGADEARNRACLRFKLNANRFPYFKTLHSICFSMLPKREVMQWHNWVEIGRQLGLFFSTQINPMDPVPRGNTKGDYFLALWSLSRVMRLTPQEVFLRRANWLMGHDDVELREFEHFIASILEYKQAMGRIDFTDMLEEYLAVGPHIRPQIVIVDEAQDLSYIHWEVVQKLCVGARQIYVAGDDDQCIHEWNGAFPKGFIDLPSNRYSVLPVSYRIPASVHTMAEHIISQVKTRLPKEYKPREAAGRVTRVEDIHQIDLSKGTWLLLARNLTFLGTYIEACRQMGWLWTSPNVASMDKDVLNAIHYWKRLRTEAIQSQEAKLMYRFMTPGNRITRGNKKKLEAVPDGVTLTHSQLVKDYGLLAANDLPWNVALDGIVPEEKVFLLTVEKNEGLGAKPRIEIGTIHSAKGKEADSVVLNPNMTYRTAEAFDSNPDAEHRVWYVGVTRAREELFVINPTTPRNYPL